MFGKLSRDRSSGGSRVCRWVHQHTDATVPEAGAASYVGQRVLPPQWLDSCTLLKHHYVKPALI